MSKEKVIAAAPAISAKNIESLRSRLKGMLLQPGDQQYQKASTPWNLAIPQHPALVVMATSADDIIAAVQFAGETNIGIGVMTTGHGIGIPCDNGLLINTTQMRAVKIDPVAKVAKVEAGVLWKDVMAAAGPHGLVGLAGSASHVGVVGYTLGGGFGYLGRKYGLNSASVIAADIVTADGKFIRVSADENTELFRGLKGSVGNFGIVTSLEFRLYPLTKVYGGAVFYPVEMAKEALNFYARWSEKLPDEMTVAFTFMNIPSLPFVPELLRGKSVILFKGCYCGEDAAKGEELFAPVRSLGGSIMDTFRIMPVSEMDTISNDPVDPLGSLQFSSMISDLSTDAINAFIKIAGPGSGSPLIIVELRRLGGALQSGSQDLRLLGDENARFILNALGPTFTPEMASKVSSHLTLLDESTRQFQTGETFINFVEGSPTTDRVRSAYTAKDWKRLVELKTKYDPKNIFRFNRNIPPRY